MSPRPADEARRALREARERAGAPGGEHGPAAPAATSSEAPAEAAPSAPSTPAHSHERAPDGRPAEPSGPRPGDTARAALRRTRHAGAHDPAGARDAPSHREGPAGGAEPASPARPPGSADPGDSARRAEEGDRSDDATTPTAPTAPDEASRSGAVEGGDSRPADVAREALRAARRKAKADAASEVASAKGASAKGAAHPRRAPRPAGGRRRAGGPDTADARARAVRDFVAGAFRLPSEADPAGQISSAGETGGTGESGETLPAGERAGRAPRGVRASASPEPGPSSGVGPDSGTGTPPAASPPAGRTPRSEDPAPDPGRPERRRHPEQASAVRDRAAAHPAPPPAPPPARPRAPRSMAAPDRDGELRRTFPALPPRAVADEGLAGTWWGNAWVTALEEGALDPARLERGRGYAERGRVDAITVTPGLVLAYVQGSRARPYRVQVRLRTLGDADWDRFLDAAVERPGHIAALLDKELPHSLADLADHGVPLLPGPGDLAPQCSCPDSGHPCKHAAALCYQTARLLDADPFVLLLLRGRGERELLDALSRRNAARAARTAQDGGPAPLPGVRAGEVLARRVLPPLPAPLPAPPHPEQPPACPTAPGGPDSFALDQLATDAAARAHALLTTGRDPVGGLTLWQDAVRLAAARPGSGLTAGTRALYASLASAAGRDTAELARAVAAWRQGGPEGLDVLEEPWDPPAGRFDRARPLLLAADLPAFRPWRNRLTHPRGHVQLRLGRTGLWYAYESEPGREDWWPRGTPDLDPVGALTGLGTRVDL
ncbi:SWIM zinc finger family protein [Streptomyces ardesiacus]